MAFPKEFRAFLVQANVELTEDDQAATPVHPPVEIVVVVGRVAVVGVTIGGGVGGTGGWVPQPCPILLRMLSHLLFGKLRGKKLTNYCAEFIFETVLDVVGCLIEGSQNTSHGPNERFTTNFVGGELGEASQRKSQR